MVLVELKEKVILVWAEEIKSISLRIASASLHFNFLILNLDFYFRASSTIHTTTTVCIGIEWEKRA